MYFLLDYSAALYYVKTSTAFKVASKSITNNPIALKSYLSVITSRIGSVHDIKYINGESSEKSKS